MGQALREIQLLFKEVDRPVKEEQARRVRAPWRIGDGIAWTLFLSAMIYEKTVYLNH